MLVVAVVCGYCGILHFNNNRFKVYYSINVFIKFNNYVTAGILNCLNIPAFLSKYVTAHQENLSVSVDLSIPDDAHETIIYKNTYIYIKT